MCNWLNIVKGSDGEAPETAGVSHGSAGQTSNQPQDEYFFLKVGVNIVLGRHSDSCDPSILISASRPSRG